MSDRKYWLYEWLDSYLIRSERQAEHLLEQSQARRSLQEAASDAMETMRPTQHADGIAIVAGNGIDLSGSFTCLDVACQKEKVDRLFNHVWHYFDRIVVEAICSHCVAQDWSDNEEFYHRLLDHIRILLYVRNRSAEDLLLFVEKPSPCIEHWQDHAEEVGLHGITQFAHERMALLDREAQLELQLADEGHYFFGLIHSSLETVSVGLISKTEDVETWKKNKVTELVLAEVASLVSDIQASQALQSPLGAALPVYDQMLRKTAAPPTEAAVAFHLRLPVLQGIDPEVLLRVRHDEQPSFQTFRDSLRLAIRERVKTVGSVGAEVIAREIESDVIQPALHDIERRLEEAKKVLARKSGLSLGVGALVTTCGLLMANPILLAAGISSTASLIPVGHKYIEEQRDIALSDMYFLWQAQQHANFNAL
jgi:hypothetical protein